MKKNFTRRSQRRRWAETLRQSILKKVYLPEFEECRQAFEGRLVRNLMNSPDFQVGEKKNPPNKWASAQNKKIFG
ncbi:MAG: hypothetical protein Q7S39_12815 [Ignavibacteria bacterium]|nr:hypothetical protein [Ignavibacteria bacterium]